MIDIDDKPNPFELSNEDEINKFIFYPKEFYYEADFVLEENQKNLVRRIMISINFVYKKILLKLFFYIINFENHQDYFAQINDIQLDKNKQKSIIIDQQNNPSIKASSSSSIISTKKANIETPIMNKKSFLKLNILKIFNYELKEVEDYLNSIEPNKIESLDNRSRNIPSDLFNDLAILIEKLYQTPEVTDLDLDKKEQFFISLQLMFENLISNFDSYFKKDYSKLIIELFDLNEECYLDSFNILDKISRLNDNIDTVNYNSPIFLQNLFKYINSINRYIQVINLIIKIKNQDLVKIINQIDYIYIYINTFIDNLIEINNSIELLEIDGRINGIINLLKSKFEIISIDNYNKFLLDINNKVTGLLNKDDYSSESNSKTIY